MSILFFVLILVLKLVPEFGVQRPGSAGLWTGFELGPDVLLHRQEVEA